MDPVKIGKFIAENRKKKKMTQEQLGEKIGVTAKTISRWENGNYMPDISLLKPLSQELEITLNDLISGEKVEEENYYQKTEENMDLILREYYQMKKQRKLLKICFFTVCAIFIGFVYLVLGFSKLLHFATEKEVVIDLRRYTEVIGETAKGNYANKWEMDESIFPKTLENKEVQDFKMIYYNPWDKEFLSYLVVRYSEEEHASEIQRLQEIGIQPYQGNYGVTGFSQYELVAMVADDYHGFVYAITDGESQIIYVELIFCNYFLDIPYAKEIPKEYLPDGFDAMVENPYRKRMLKETENF